jgi:hypothetical protein
MAEKGGHEVHIRVSPTTGVIVGDNLDLLVTGCITKCVSEE